MKNFKEVVLASFLAALMYNIISDIITGSSQDIIAPLLSYIIPGEINEPLKIGRIKLYLNRWCVRFCNLLCGLYIAFTLHKISHKKSDFF